MGRVGGAVLLGGLIAGLTLGLTACMEIGPLRALIRADVTRGVAPLTVVFDLAGSSGAITGFLLDFGDGETHVGDVARGLVPLTVTFDISRSEGAIVSYTLDFGDGNAHTAGGALRPAAVSILQEPISHTYTEVGVYRAVLTVHDRWGRSATDSVEIIVEPSNLRAILNATPQTGYAPLEVTFDISNSEGPILYFILDFGDGDMITGIDITYAIIHSYSRPGTYTASLTVVDVYGRSDVATVEIEVQ